MKKKEKKMEGESDITANDRKINKMQIRNKAKEIDKANMINSEGKKIRKGREIKESIRKGQEMNKRERERKRR